MTVQNSSAGSIYFTVNTRDPRADGGAPAGRPYTGPIELNGPTILTARVRDGEGHWSTPTVASFTAPAPTGEEPLLHYWSFNSQTLLPFFTIGGGSLSVSPGPLTDVTFDIGADFVGINNRLGEETGSHLRVNNPLGATLTFALPTTGYEDIAFRYESRRSGQGAGLQQLSYTVNGSTYVEWPNPVMLQNDSPQIYFFDFSEIAGANDNPIFGIRLTFAQGDGGTAGNNRFDNITVEGAPCPGRTSHRK